MLRCFFCAAQRKAGTCSTLDREIESRISLKKTDQQKRKITMDLRLLFDKILDFAYQVL